MVFPIQTVVFFVFASLVVLAALMTIVARNPVHAILFLVGAFFASSVLWILIQAEFLALALIFVYVGAVMTLFLFVVMMLNIDLTVLRQKFVRYLPLGALILALIVAILLVALNARHFPASSNLLPQFGKNYSNVTEMGMLLYSQYYFPFEIAAVLLLVAIVAAISLAFYGRKPDAKAQNIALQHRANKKDRLKIVKM